MVRPEAEVRAELALCEAALAQAKSKTTIVVLYQTKVTLLWVLGEEDGLVSHPRGSVTS